MTPSPSMLPVSGEQHEKAREAAHWALDGTLCDFDEDAGRYYPIDSSEHGNVPRDEEAAVEAVLAAYFDSLAAQGVRLVDSREVAEWLRGLLLPSATCKVMADNFLTRFGGGDER